MSHYLHDPNHTRLHVVKSVPGAKVINWLFLPGGPGVDSNSLAGLVKQMNLAGNYWLVDLIFNGTNENHPGTSDDFFEQDQRFHRQNIQITNIPNAGHFPWVEQPDLINQTLEAFVQSYNLM